ncbi:MAG: hypothetical protein LH467_09135 [Gemmatimonadaceae bacterium]|nr:hypothetical protein [Gemmatimonadaceae bacterium]
MKTDRIYLLSAAVALLAALPTGVNAQTFGGKKDTAFVVTPAGTAKDSSAAADSLAAAKRARARYLAPSVEIQHMRANDNRGLNVFESPKEAGASYDGFKLAWGGAFSQLFQNITHENTAAPRLVNTVNQNALIRIGSGFNTANANLYLNAQLARGIRVAVETYASSRHHNEFWVKDGYFLIDGSPIESDLLDMVMNFATLKVGHFEVNYGDQHFRRSDNGQTIYNPFVGNFVMDAFTTEIGAEAYLRAGGYMAMVGMTGGEIKGQVTSPEKRGPTYLAKLGVDKQLSTDLRMRLTGSLYKKDQAANGTLTSGDRAGSKYYSVLENTSSVESAQAWSGAVQSGMRNMVTAFVVNPFVKYRGAEFFGNVETMTGAAANEPKRRTLRQHVGEGLYRFADDKLYLGGRYNVVKGQLAGIPNDITVRRTQMGGGWFVTPNVLSKIEFVQQRYLDFPTTDIRNGGKFKGFVVEGVVAF